MKLTPTHLEGCFVLEPNVIHDGRGWFMESYNQSRFEQLTGQDTRFVQDNQSFSTRGVLRGLHYQTGEHAQAKLVRVLHGEVLDVAVDIRPGSATYGQYASVLLTAENNKQFFVPRGFAHGFAVLSPTAVFFYKCDNFYNKESEGGIKFDDPSLGIDWMLPASEHIISEKDKFQPLFENARAIW